MKTARRKGHEYEREVARLYRGAGFLSARTARSVSGGMQTGPDILGLPFPVECKRVGTAFPLLRALNYVEDSDCVVHVKLDRHRAVVVVAEDRWLETMRKSLESSRA